MVGGVACETMSAPLHVPLATYRLQLNRDFTFTQATEIVPYLSTLGISHCYISPCLKARAGSLHGYDIVDHNSLNPEIGTEEDFDRFVFTLHQHGMGLILDIVPNHMGVMGSDNAWWLDVLENGQSSPYADFFDIDWHPIKEELHGKVLVPALHDHYGAVLESGELKLVFRPERGEFDVGYRTHRFPVDPKEYPRVLEHCAETLAIRLGRHNPDLLEFQSLIASFGHLPERQDSSSERIAERNRDKEIHKHRLAELCARSPEVNACLSRAVDRINGDPADPASFEELHELIKAQTFRLANWRVASDDINYRRFFDTNDLAGLRVENERVFQAAHKLVLHLVATAKVDGLRIDHPDGLYDPAQYFERLARSIVAARKSDANGPFYVVIEKILTGAERLPSAWPVCGTTGYDFATLVNGLFVDAASGKRLERIYRAFVAEEIELDDLFYRCRKLIIRVALASELNLLATNITRIALSKRHTCDFTLNRLREALTEIVASFPVYRTYVNGSGVSESDAGYIQAAVAAAKQRSPAADTSIFDFVGQVLLTRIADGQDAVYRRAVTEFAMKFQQFTSPVMAKGLEDTAFYRYNRLVSLNDVGSDLHCFGTTVSDFHLASQERINCWPHTMLATSTHDSKRSEDVRARINALSEMPEVWKLRLRDWRHFNRGHKSLVNGKPAPSSNDEYLLYQTLLGSWPITPLTQDSDWEAYRDRIEKYMLKAVREAKENTSWINQNSSYERAVSSFVRALLTPGGKNRFLSDFIPFQRRISRIGFWNSLSQTLLKLTTPGVPDIYQANEVWDFSLVDPDNRRPVDYNCRREILGELCVSGALPMRSLLQTPEDGRLKMFLIWKTLCLRRQHTDLFEQGEYLPLGVGGKHADRVVAFARKLRTSTVVVVVPHLVAGLLKDVDLPPIGRPFWDNTHIVLPQAFKPGRCQNFFTAEILDLEESANQPRIDVSRILAHFPVGILTLDYPRNTN
jgi:(1->4)-alpha-D-glucan 1-alpha-D-glucosylmutase